MSTRWREHEERAARSSHYHGYRVETQKVSRSVGIRADIFAVNGKERKVGEAKYCLKAQRKHVHQVIKYKSHPFYASSAVLHYPKNAEIPAELRDYAKSRGVVIVRTRVPKVKERQPGVLNWFSKKQYLR